MYGVVVLENGTMGKTLGIAIKNYGSLREIENRLVS